MAGLTAHRSYLSGERSLASDTIWHLKLESIENTAIQQIVCLYTFAQCWKTKSRQTKLLRPGSYVALLPCRIQFN